MAIRGLAPLAVVSLVRPLSVPPEGLFAIVSTIVRCDPAAAVLPKLSCTAT